MNENPIEAKCKDSSDGLTEREKAERQKKISEQAAFLATWAAGVLV
jgi:hypothetical protein